MMTISLDEYGSFENRENRKCLIGGVVYDGPKDPREQDRELARINQYLRDACRACGARFPQALHFERDASGAILNLEEVNAVKSRIEETFAAFLAEAEPRGRYYLYTLAADREGVSMFRGSGVGNLLQDAYAGNRYLHMAGMALHNLLVNNPVLQARDYHLELATRVLKPGGDEALRQESRALGYSNQNRGAQEPGGDYYSLTNVNSYISIISSIMLENERKDVNFKLNVQSINYRSEDASFKQGFLYLADIVCSLLQGSLSGSGPMLERLARRAAVFTTHDKNMIWAYSDTDVLFQEAVRQRVAGNWFACLSLLYDTARSGRPEAAYYQDFWSTRVLSRLRREVSPAVLSRALRDLERYIHTPGASTDKAWYIAEPLKRIVEHWEGPGCDACRYALYSCLTTLCNHRGMAQEAMEYYEKCVANAQYAPIDRYLELRNMFTVALLDQLRFDEALENTQETLTCEELIEDVRRSLYPNADDTSLHYGMTLSQLGQVHAFRGDHDQAQAYFAKALEKFGQDSINLQITRSYLLHSYIENSQRADYEALSELYFGASRPDRQLDAIETMADTSQKFALYVWAKAWRRFYAHEASKAAAQQLLTRVLRRQGDRLEHPWELIAKHCALSALTCGLPKTAAQFAEKLQASAAAPSGDVLAAICQNGLQEYESAAKKQDFHPETRLTYMYD